MTDALSTWLTRFKADPTRFGAQLREPVLWLEHVRDEEEEMTNDERSLHTATGTGPNPLHGEPRLVVVRKNKDNAFQRRVTVGRTPNNDVVIDDASVSRFHAWFEQAEDGTWVVVDAGSKNGSYVSTKKLAPKKPHSLRGGEKVRFGTIDGWFLTPERVMDRLRRRAG